ncbi:MAG TPA: type II toxin-antitoxin system VapC family toxin [Steroidobacteraceae bacterium]|nr:type II toxin-antitoxin system VapC family toxin [Steroidobacteraceae bacterium]
MRVLLDTHVLLWALAYPTKLSPETRRQIDSAEVFVSAASLWEISIKSSIGKLQADPAQILACIDPAGFEILPVLAEHAVKVARLPHIHRDPFDRMLVAQASTEPMLLLTDDAGLKGYGDCVQVI